MACAFGRVQQKREIRLLSFVAWKTATVATVNYPTTAECVQQQERQQALEATLLRLLERGRQYAQQRQVTPPESRGIAWCLTWKDFVATVLVFLWGFFCEVRRATRGATAAADVLAAAEVVDDAADAVLHLV